MIGVVLTIVLLAPILQSAVNAPVDITKLQQDSVLNAILRDVQFALTMELLALNVSKDFTYWTLNAKFVQDFVAPVPVTAPALN